MRIIFTTFFLLFTFALIAQQKVESTIYFNHVALSVADVDKSANFYENVLGLNEITNRTEKEGIRWFSLGEDIELHLISTVHSKLKLNKAMHFAITTKKFSEFVKSLDNRNIPYSDWPGSKNTVTTRADGIKQIYVQDPDGHWIEVNSAAGAN